MSLLKLQDLEPVNTAYGMAAVSVTSSSSDCCKNDEEIQQ